MLNYLNKEEIRDFFLSFWLPGLIISLYFIFKNLLFIDGESLEWAIYISSFLIFFLISFNSNYLNNKLLFIKSFLIIPFILFIISDLINYDTIFILIISFFFLLVTTKFSYDSKLNYFYHYLIFFLVFFIGIKIIYFTSFYNFFFNSTKNFLPNASQYIIPGIILIIFLFLIFILNKIKSDHNKIIYFWWFLPLIIFFLESFSTAELFSHLKGGFFHHWQPYTGVLSMINQGGYLLWDVPSQYGFLSLLTIYIFPVVDPWLKLYYINGIINLSIAIISFYIIWNKKGIIWYFITLILIFSINFILTGGSENFENLSQVPSSNGLRYCWFFFITCIFYFIKNYSFLTKSLIVLPFWTIGFFWSVESAFYVSSIIGGYLLYICFLSKITIKDRIIITLLFPFSIFISLIFISSFYFINIGHLPDFFSFIEYAGIWVNHEDISLNNGRPSFFNLKGSVWIILFIFSFLLFLKNKINKNYEYLWFIIIFGLWSIFSYSIPQSNDAIILNLLYYFIICTFIIFNILDKKYFDISFKIFYPIIIFILIFAFGNPKILIHINKTIINQDYSLKNSFSEKNRYLDDVNILLSEIKPKNTPVIFIERGRYLNYLYPNEYVDTKLKKNIKLSNELWLPLYPATLFDPLLQDRRTQYISRWINRNKFAKGWLITSVNDHWHENIDLTIENALIQYTIIDKKQYGGYQASLYVLK